MFSIANYDLFTLNSAANIQYVKLKKNYIFESLVCTLIAYTRSFSAMSKSMNVIKTD